MCATVKVGRLGKFDLNPRGNLWLKDENRFGHKLLSKMGWSQGKGLGKNEDGIPENLKVKRKGGNTGIGWSEKIPLAAENEEYDTILANLNEKFNSSENKTKKEDVKSLELRSQQFKKRLHYGKFVRGKDVCRYSEKDMNSIFVIKKPKSEPTLAHVKSTVTNIESSSTEDEAPETTPTFKSQLSMKEYFESKMEKKLGNSVNSNNETETSKTEETIEKEVSSKKKNRKKRLKLDPHAFDNSCSGDNSPDSNSVTETQVAKENSTEEEITRKKSKPNNCTEKPPDLVELEDSSNKDETLKYSFNSKETVNVEEPSVKKNASNRKRSKTLNTEKPKRLKLSLDHVEEHSSTMGCIGKESGDIIELSESSCSIIENEDPQEVEGAVTKKKEKIDALKKAHRHKQAKTEAADISEESTSLEPNNKEIEVLGVFPQPEIQILTKNIMKFIAKKPKLDTITKLKTRLKRSQNYSLAKESKKVSFNKHVVYKTINSDVKGEVIIECPYESVIKKSDNKKVVKRSLSTCMQNSYGPCGVETDEMPNCMNLPKCDSSNSWLENQRLATKMKLYQNMVREMKKHPVLKTSNLLDLKGYGNWGF